MHIRILISIIFMGLLNTFAQNTDTTLVLNQLEIKDSNDNLVEILNKISFNEQKNYGKLDTLLYEFLISRTPENLRIAMNNHESVYITGINDEWPMPSKAFSSILGYIEVDNLFFIVSDGGGFPKDYFSNIFFVKDIKKSFSLSEYKEKEIFEEDDSVIRIWCHFLYKDGRFKILETSCYDNNGLPYLFEE